MCNISNTSDLLRTLVDLPSFHQVLKNRFSGDLGPMPLHFNKDSLSFAVRRRKKAVDPDQQAREPGSLRGDETPAVKRRSPVAQTRKTGSAAAETQSGEPAPEMRSEESNSDGRDADSGPGLSDQTSTPKPSEPGPFPARSSDADPESGRPR